MTGSGDAVTYNSVLHLGYELHSEDMPYIIAEVPQHKSNAHPAELSNYTRNYGTNIMFCTFTYTHE